MADGVDDGVDSSVCGDLAGIVAAHAVGNDTEPKLFIDREAILIGGPDRALLADSPRLQHSDTPAGLKSCATDRQD